MQSTLNYDTLNRLTSLTAQTTGYLYTLSDGQPHQRNRAYGPLNQMEL